MSAFINRTQVSETVTESLSPRVQTPASAGQDARSTTSVIQTLVWLRLVALLSYCSVGRDSQPVLETPVGTRIRFEGTVGKC